MARCVRARTTPTHRYIGKYKHGVSYMPRFFTLHTHTHLHKPTHRYTDTLAFKVGGPKTNRMRCLTRPPGHPPHMLSHVCGDAWERRRHRCEH